MSDETAPSPSIIDPFKLLQIVPNADGTFTRHNLFPNIAATPDPVDNLAVLSKDVPINQSNNTWVRIFLPRQALESSFSTKLPLILHFHGGGFVVCSAASSFSHDFCSNVALKLPAVVVSLEYRLAPEHRLPAAYDDAMEALHWIKTSQDEWLQKYADFSHFYLMGESSGANIAYHAGLRAATQVENLLPLKIRGLILPCPYFGGVKRTESELRLLNDWRLPASVNDAMWELALPIGADRDHEYCNPTVGDGSKLLDQIRMLEWKVMVTGRDGDPLIDRQIEVVKIMENKGVEVMSHFEEGGYHAQEFDDPTKSRPLLLHIKNFVLSCHPPVAERVTNIEW